MKRIRDLTKNELLSFIINNMPSDTDTFTENCECAVCGKSNETIYYYICDSCNIQLEKS
jgi:hypothetical protein